MCPLVVHQLEELRGGEQRLISVSFDSTRVFLLSSMAGEIVSAKLLCGGVFFLKKLEKLFAYITDHVLIKCC